MPLYDYDKMHQHVVIVLKSPKTTVKKGQHPLLDLSVHLIHLKIFACLHLLTDLQ